MKDPDQSGVALVTVVIVLASIALLMSGVYSLVSEGSRSANQEVNLEVTRSTTLSGLDRVESLINQVAVPGFTPPAPDGYGVLVSATAGDGQWNGLQGFADYLRGQISRASGDGPDKCGRANPDLAYTVPASEGDVRVAICVRRTVTGALPGTSSGVVFANARGNVASGQSLYEVQVWATGPRSVLAQMQGVGRGIH